MGAGGSHVHFPCCIRQSLHATAAILLVRAIWLRSRTRHGFRSSIAKFNFNMVHITGGVLYSKVKQEIMSVTSWSTCRIGLPHLAYSMEQWNM